MSSSSSRGRRTPVPFARIEPDVPRDLRESLLLVAGGFAMTTRRIGRGVSHIPAGEMVGITYISRGTPPNRRCRICWVNEDATAVAQTTVRESSLRPVIEIVMAA